MATKKNPLDDFVATGGSGTSDVRVEPMPNLADFIKQSGFSEGLVQHGAAMETWRQNHERMLNERLQGKPVVSTGKL